MDKVSHFFAYLSRLKYIKRWAVMRNAQEEDVAVHSWEVGTIAFALGVIHNSGDGIVVDPYRLATLGLFHDSTEVATGDGISGVKTFSRRISDAFKELDTVAEGILIDLLPDTMKDAFAEVLKHSVDPVERKLVKAADLISALIKCRIEESTGNKDFHHAARRIHARIEAMECDAANQFINVFVPSYSLPLDSLVDVEKDNLEAMGDVVRF